MVGGEPLSQDIEMAAAQVTVSGTITDILDSDKVQNLIVDGNASLEDKAAQQPNRQRKENL